MISNNLYLNNRIYSYVIFLYIFVFWLVCFIVIFPSIVGLENNEKESENIDLRIINISINDFSERISLNPNNTKQIECVALIENNGNNLNDNNIKQAESYFYNKKHSLYNNSDDKNYHYSNSSCNIDNSFEEWNNYTNKGNFSLIRCSFDVEYYAAPGTWECYFNIKTNEKNISNKSETEISELLAVSIPDYIEYGSLYVKEISKEAKMRIENIGNIKVNLGIFGYAERYRDGFALKCSKGEIEKIPLEYQRYSIGKSHPGNIIFSEFKQNYKALSEEQKIERIGLEPRQNDTKSEAFEYIYWRAYIPKGVAGECEGNLGITGLRG